MSPKTFYMYLSTISFILVHPVYMVSIMGVGEVFVFSPSYLVMDCMFVSPTESYVEILTSDKLCLSTWTNITRYHR